MGSVIYDFLADSLFFHEKSLKDNFRNESDKRLKKELEAYRKHCVTNQKTLINEIKEKKSSLKVFSSVEKMQLNLIKQTALYIDQFIIYDPLFRHTNFQSDMAKVTSQYLGYQQDEDIDRPNLTKAAKLLSEITPMVAGDYVKIFPFSYHFEAPPQLPINLPVDYYNGILPKPILEFFWKNASIRSMKKDNSGKGGWIVDENKLYPCRGIVIDFKESNFNHSMIYHLFEMEIMDLDEETGQTTFRQTLPETPPSVDYFKAWVTQSINRASKAYFDKVFKEAYIATNLNSTYLCDNNFTNKLLSRNFETNENISTFTANQLLNLELPFLDNIDIQKLMDVRNSEKDVFTNFRLELEKSFRDLRNESDEKVLKQKTENIFHELNEVQTHKIKLKIEQMKKRLAANVSIGLGGLAGSVQTSGLSLIATAIYLAKGYKDYVKDKTQIKENPSYLLWKTRKK